jgi:hypothetical protein
MKQHASDTSQRINIALGFCGELYKALMASMLIMFVPQDCGDSESCGLTERLFTGSDPLYMSASCMNVITFLGFSYLYYVEISRENKMIEYLEMNRELPKDDEAVGEALVKLGSEKVAELHVLDTKYRTAGHAAMGCFAVNTILSSIPIIDNRLDAKTYTVLVTNALFIVAKLMEVREVVNTKPNVFYSAYLTERSQFNDCDPDHVIGETVAEEEAVTTETESKLNDDVIIVEDEDVTTETESKLNDDVIIVEDEDVTTETESKLHDDVADMLDPSSNHV